MLELLMQMQNPEFQEQAKAIVNAILVTNARCERMEAQGARMERMLQWLMEDRADARLAASGTAELGADGAGPCATPRRDSHDGISGVEAAPRRAGNGA